MVAAPVKLLAGVNSTAPVVVLTLHVLPLASMNVVCWPAVAGSRAVVLITIELPMPKAVSFVVISGRVTGVLSVVVVLSSVAAGGNGTGIVTVRFAVAL